MFRQSSSDDEEFERTIPLNQHESMRDSTHNSQVPYLSYHALTETSGRRSQDQTPPSPEEQTDVATSLIQNSHSDSRRAPTVGGSRRVPVVNVVVNNENRDSEPLTLIRADHQISQLSRSDTQTRTPLSDQSPLMDPLGMVTPDVNGQVRSDRASRLSFAPPTSILDPHLTAGGKRTTSDRRMSPPKFPQFAADRREVSFSLGTMGSVHTKRRIGPMQLIREVVIRQDRAASALFRPMNPSDLPPLGTDALQQPSELTDDGAAVLTNYYGLRGRNMDEQQTLEEKDEEPPKDIESMPLRGGIRSVSLFNPFCLTAFIVLIPFIFMIIAFGVSYRDVTDNKDSKQVVRMAQLLNQLVTDLVEEAAAAAALNALAVQRDSYANNLTTFFIMWNVLGNEFQGSQTAADTTISKIGSLIDSYDNEYRLLLGSVSPWAYLDMSALSKARVQASVSTINAYTMTNYDNIINRVLLYYGGLALASFFLVKTDVTQIQSAASLQMLMVVNALYEFLIQKANENNVADLSNVPSNNEELQFIYDAVAALRITERTLRFPSSLDSTVDVTGPGFAPAAMSFINKDSGLFEIQLPPVILETLLSMVALTIDTPTYNGFDPANGEMLRLYINTLNTVIVPDTSRDWMNTIDQINTHRQKVQEACLFVILVLSIVGIVYHVLAVAFFWRRMPVHMRYNHYAQNLRQALERMHNHTLSILRFASSPMIEEQSLVDGSLRRPITIEEHRLCLSALMVQKLEPFLPLPMRLPPPGAPQSALVHGNFFCRPSLFVRDGLVAIHVSFAYIHLKSDDERSATILTLDETGTTVPTENRITQLDLLQTSIHGKKGKKVHRRELNYSKYCRDILHQLCHFSNAHMPHSKTGAFLQQCGDSAMLWLNMCEDIPYPHLTAFSICAAVEEYCLHRQLDVPSMVVGSGSAAVGNIPSFSSVPSTLEPMENYFQVWSKSPFFDPSLDVTAAKPQGATDLTTGDAQNSNHTELLAATANMPTKTRAKFWFRQLLGLKLEVKKQQKSFSSAEIASRTEKEERAALLASTSVDSDDEMTLPEKVSPQYTPDAKSSCLTSCVVYGEVMHEIDALRQLGRIHKEHVVASERAIEQMVAEKQRFDADFESGRAQEMFRSSDEALMDETSKTLPSDPESSNPTSPKGRLNRKDSWMMNNSTSITSKGSKWDSDQQNTVHAFFSADNIPERFRQLDLQGIPMDMYCYARTVTSKSIETVKKKKKKGDSEASAAAPTEDAEEEEEDSVRLLDMDSEDTRFHQYSRRIASKEQTITLTEGVRCNRRARHDMRAAYCLGWRTAAPVEHHTGDGTRRASLSKQRVLSRSGLPSDPTAYDQTIRSWIVLFREYYPFACAVAELEPTNRRLTDSDNRRMTALCLNLQNAIDTYGSNTSTAFLGRSTLAHMQDVLHLVRQCVENGPFSELGFSPFSIQAIEIVLINEAAMM